MNITWYGHRCVRIEAKEGTVLIDPFGKDVGLRGPRINDDLVLISSYGAPVGVTDQLPEGALVITGPGEYERKGIAVKGIQAWQDSQNGKELGLATIYTVVADEISVCHLGALGQDKLTDEQMEAIGDPDILIIPVGGQSALDAKAAAALATQIEPKVIIPIQFALPNASYEAEKIDKFVKEIGLSPQKMESFRIVKKQLPMDQTLLIVLSA
jgi:L-ascorbate metabolism protein UlaG (beta-lactamase superfamily)